MKPAIWQIYLVALKHIPRPTFNVESPNVVQQADLLFLPHDEATSGVQKVEKYAWTVASRFQGAEPLTHAHKVSQRLFRQSISEDNCDGRKFFRLILGVNSWLTSQERWQSMM